MNGQHPYERGAIRALAGATHAAQNDFECAVAIHAPHTKWIACAALGTLLLPISAGGHPFSRSLLPLRFNCAQPGSGSMPLFDRLDDEG